MRVLPLVALLILAASPAYGDHTAPARGIPVELTRPTSAVTESAPRPDLILTDVATVRRTASAEATPALQDMPERGGLWVIIGAVVVAGLILVLLLN